MNDKSEFNNQIKIEDYCIKQARDLIHRAEGKMWEDSQSRGPNANEELAINEFVAHISYDKFKNCIAKQRGK